MECEHHEGVANITRFFKKSTSPLATRAGTLTGTGSDADAGSVNIVKPAKKATTVTKAWTRKNVIVLFGAASVVAILSSLIPSAMWGTQ